MIRKVILLNTFFLPFALVSYHPSSEMRIKELKELHFQKQLQLSDIGKMIADRDEFIRSSKEILSPVFSSIKNKKIDALVKKNGKVSQEEINKIEEEIENSNDFFLKKYYESDHKDIKEVLMTELFDQESINTSFTSFESLRFTLLRIIMEHSFLLNLTEKYAV